MKAKCKTCALNSRHLFFYSRFGTAVFVVFGLSFAFMATVDISEIEIAQSMYFSKIWSLGFMIWLVYRVIIKTPNTCE